MDMPTERYDWRTALTEQRRPLYWLADETGKSRRTVYAYSRGDLIPPKEWIEAVKLLLEKDRAAA